MNLAILGLERDLSKCVDFASIIDLLAAEKARRVALIMLDLCIKIDIISNYHKPFHVRSRTDSLKNCIEK